MAAEVVIDIRAEDNTSGVLGNIATAGFAVLTAAVAAMGATLYSSVQSAMESQNAIADLEATLQSTNFAAGMTSQQLQDMATNLQNVTKFSDETIISGEAMLLTFTNIGSDVFPQATEAMLNLAEKFGSVETASVQLGKALNDPIAGVTALRRVGVQLSDDQEAQIKSFMAVNDIASAQGVILAELEKEFGGLAVAAGQTFAGQMEIAKNKLDNIKETIGNALLPTLTELLGKFSDFATSPVMTQFLDNFTAGLTKLAEFISNPANLDLGNLSQMFADWTASIDWDKLSNDLAAGIASIDWAVVGQEIMTVITNIFNGIGTIIEKIDWAALGVALGNAFADLVAGMYGYADWDALAVDFGAGLEYALVSGFGYMRWDDLARDFKNGFVYIGQQAKLGLAEAFGYDDFQQFATDLKEGFQVVINSIKSFLGISSPSTVFASIGKDIVLGLISGWTSTVGSLLDAIDTTLTDIGNLFGIDLSSILGGSSASGLGTAGGGTGTTGGGTGGGSTSGQTVINIYGTSYWGVSGPGDVGSVYDCPSPNALVASSANQLVTTGF